MSLPISNVQQNSLELHFKNSSGPSKVQLNGFPSSFIFKNFSDIAEKMQKHSSLHIIVDSRNFIFNLEHCFAILYIGENSKCNSFSKTKIHFYNSTDITLHVELTAGKICQAIEKRELLSLTDSSSYAILIDSTQIKYVVQE